MEIKHTMVLDGSDSLSKALSELDVSPAVIVTKNGKYFGIIDHRSLSPGIRNPENVKCETVIAKPPILLENAGLMERVEAFLVGHFRALPVVDERKAPLGVTTRVELLKEMLVESMVPKVDITSVMSTPVFTIDENQTIADAKGILKENKAHRLIVMRKGKLIGTASTFDVGGWSARQNLPGGRKDIKHSEPINVDTMCISSFLRPDMTIVEKGCSLDDAVRKMIDKQVSHVVIVSDSRPLGVVSATDIFRIIQAQSQEAFPIQISGLGEENAPQFDRIQLKLGRVFERFGRSMNVRNCSFHVKEGKSTYALNVFFDTDEGHVSLKLERGDLKEAIDEMANEVNEVLRKKKEMRRQKPRTVHAH
ncbi:MAG: CBS domain-containing protein [Candidatus Micrarchaeota archaeon]